MLKKTIVYQILYFHLISFLALDKNVTYSLINQRLFGSCPQRMKSTCRRLGIPILDEYLLHLNFADDHVLIAEDAFDLQCEGQEWRLTINVGYTE